MGDYHRFMLPGLYTLEISAPGYVTSVLSNVPVGVGSAVRRDEEEPEGLTPGFFVHAVARPDRRDVRPR